MSNFNQVASTVTQQTVPVQAQFNAAGECLGLVGPGGVFFSPPLTNGTIAGSAISGSTITTSTLTSPVVTAPVLSLRVTTEADLGDIANAINIAGKTQGSIVFATDSTLIYVAFGATAGASWFPSSGGAPITPA